MSEVDEPTALQLVDCDYAVLLSERNIVASAAVMHTTVTLSLN